MNRVRYQLTHDELAWAREAGACEAGLWRAEWGCMSSGDFLWATGTHMAPAHMFESAAMHPYWIIRYFAAKHPACPKHVLHALLLDSERRVRDQARRALSRRGLS